MMRIDDSREVGFLNEPSTDYSTLEITTRHHVSEFDVPVCKGSWKGKFTKRGYVRNVCVVLVAIAVIVSLTLVIGKLTTEKDGSKHQGIRDEPQGLAPAPGPREFTGLGGESDWMSSSSAPAVEAIAPPLSSFIPIRPAPVAVIAPSSSSPSLDVLAPYANICNKTINRVDCLNMFRNNPNSYEGDLMQWTVTAMEAAEHALNGSYILALDMKRENEGNVALQQCIDVFADALGNVNTSMNLVATMDVHNPGTIGDDVQTFMSAAMTNYDTCEEGIEDVGSFPGSDDFTGQQAKHVDTMLSIALTFVNDLTTPTMDRHHHRRLLHIEAMSSSRRRASFSGILTKIGRVFPRCYINSNVLRRRDPWFCTMLCMTCEMRRTTYGYTHRLSEARRSRFPRV